MPTKTNRITQGEYEHLCLIDVAYEGFVEGENGELLYVYCEAAVIGCFESNWCIHYKTITQSYEVPVAATDKTRVDTTNRKLNAVYDMEAGRIKADVKKQLIDHLRSYYQRNYGKKENESDSPYGSGEIKIDVPEHKRKAYFQDDFARQKSKIESGDIKRSDFKDNIQNALRREIDTYLACFDPNDPNHKTFWQKERKEPGFVESLIPVWGAAKSSEYHFYAGNQFREIAFAALAISDIALVRSAAIGMGKGAWKGGSHSWSATRKWLEKRGHVNKGEQAHHFLIHNATGKRNNIEWLVNQPWNIKAFKTRSDHMRFGHGTKFQSAPPGNKFEQIWLGTPAWSKALGGSYGGRVVIEIIDD